MAIKKSDLYSSLWASCDELRGGIPERDLDALGNYWKIMPGLRAALFGKFNRPGYSALKLPIAEVLTDMGAELVALEQRREKTRDIKQAMMQELLTGRTRLV